MEQKTTKKRMTGCIIAALISIAVLASLFFILLKYYIGPRFAADKRAEIIQPVITVHEPANGDTVFESEPLTASATATSVNPIARLELWLDGDKFLEQMPIDITDTFYAAFNFNLIEGQHVLVFRMVDREGLVAQSAPLTVISKKGTAILVLEDGRQTLDSIAEALGEDADVLQDLNPDLTEGNLPKGANIKVPKPRPQGGRFGFAGSAVIAPDPSSGINLADLYEVAKIDTAFGVMDLVSAVISNMSPVTPTSFNAEYENCVIELRWQDNAVNETHFNVWMQSSFGPPQLIATTKNNPKNGPTAFTFQSPSYGFYAFWVEAANALGSQPSEIKEVFVSDQTCKNEIATYLEIEALDMYSYNPAQGYYCYLSVEGSDFMRIPEGDGIIQVQNNWGNITKYWGGDKRILFPMPADEELNMEGYCLAKLGPLMVAPIKPFNVSVPREKWNASRLEIKTDAFLIGYRVRPFGPETASGRFQFVDYDLRSPELWNVEALGELQFPEKDWKARTVSLTWHWAGEPDEILNFLILIDGQEYRYVSKLQRQESILLGSACGRDYAFEMVAVGPGGARSTPGNTFVYQQLPCPVMAEVQFLSIKSEVVDDTDCIPPFMDTCLPYIGASCHSIGVFYEIWAMGAGQEKIKLVYGSPQISIQYKCGIEYQFSNQLRAVPDTIIVPIDPSSPGIRVGTAFWDSDDGGNDKFADIDKPIMFSYDVWPTIDQIFTFSSPIMSETADATVKIRVRGFYQPGP